MPDIVARTVQVHIARFNSKADCFEHLILKRKPEDRLYPGIWQAVTGTIEAGEKSIETAKREVAEETSLKILKFWSVPYITSFFDTRLDAVQFAPVFGVLVSEDDTVILSNEHEDYLWLKMEDCLGYFALPTHKEGTKVFDEYILNSDKNTLFQQKI